MALSPYEHQQLLTHRETLKRTEVSIEIKSKWLLDNHAKIGIGLSAIQQYKKELEKLQTIAKSCRTKIKKLERNL